MGGGIGHNKLLHNNSIMVASGFSNIKTQYLELTLASYPGSLGDEGSSLYSWYTQFVPTCVWQFMNEHVLIIHVHVCLPAHWPRP